MKKIVQILATFVMVTSTVWADDAMEMKPIDKPSMFATQAITVSAAVAAINHETREVTLTKADGETTTFVVDKEAHNLDQVQVGDIVVAEYVESISFEVVSAKNAEAEAAVASVVARAAKGEQPGGATINTVVITATVEEINLETNTFKLKGPKGKVTEYTARNPENLKRSAVGDLVIITMTEALAVSVEKAEPVTSK